VEYSPAKPQVVIVIGVDVVGAFVDPNAEELVHAGGGAKATVSV